MIDIQKQNDTRYIDLQKVGVKDVETPLIIQRKNAQNQTVFARAKMSVSLPHHYKGTHMSRFIEILEDFRKKDLLGIEIEAVLDTMCKKLDAKSAYLKFDLKYFIEKSAPKSKLKSLMAYDCFFEGFLDNGEYKFYLGAKVPIATLCPCSKEISDFGAHNQRALVRVKVSYPRGEHIWLEDLIEDIESCASSRLYPLLKRSDEKFVTETAYNNPKFVEDVIRDVVLKMRANKIINFYEVEIDAQESIHNHNAWALQREWR
jgi:GTP cyclohydrolase I